MLSEYINVYLLWTVLNSTPILRSNNSLFSSIYNFFLNVKFPKMYLFWDRLVRWGGGGVDILGYKQPNDETMIKVVDVHWLFDINIFFFWWVVLKPQFSFQRTETFNLCWNVSADRKCFCINIQFNFML